MRAQLPASTGIPNEVGSLAMELANAYQQMTIAQLVPDEDD